MQRFWDNVVGSILAIGIIVVSGFIAVCVFLLKYRFSILVVGLGVWLGISWFI